MFRSRVGLLLACTLLSGGCASDEVPEATVAPSGSMVPARTAGWSLVRRQLLAAPEGVSSSQVEAVEALLSDLREARRTGTEVDLAARERKLAASIRASAVGRRPSVQAALSRVVPEDP